MNKKSQTQTMIIGVIAVAAIVILTLPYIQNRNQEEVITQDNKIKIATTIFPLYDITKNIVGNHADVVLLVPPGASPHSYSLTPKQIASVQQTKVLFAIGHNLDDSTVKQVTQVANTSPTIVDQEISTHTYSEQLGQSIFNKFFNTNTSLVDPHYWLAVSNAKQIANNISNQIQAVDPQNAKEYANKLTDYLNQLDSLEEELQAMSQQITQPAFITAHNSWSYFAEQYNLKTAGSYEPFEGREPSFNYIKNLQQTIRQHEITTFFTEPQKPISTATKLFKDEFGLNIAVLDPIGGGEEGDSYINLMRRNMQAIKDTK